MSQKIKIAIAEDHGLTRDGYVSILTGEPNLSVVGAFENGKILIDYLKHKKVDIVLLDHQMPVLNGLETLRIIKSEFPSVRCIMVSMYCEDELVSGYFENGAVGCVDKISSSSLLIETINTVYTHGICLSKSNSEALLNKISNTARVASNKSIVFTKRELEILNVMYSGKTNKEMASYLNVSLKTIDFHKSKIYKKTGTHTSVGVIVFAIAQGLVG